jgi:hypothetical protein
MPYKHFQKTSTDKIRLAVRNKNTEVTAPRSSRLVPFLLGPLRAKLEAGGSCTKLKCGTPPLVGLAEAHSVTTILVSKSRNLLADDTKSLSRRVPPVCHMGHRKTQVFASELLASVAVEASDVLFPVAIDNKSGSAAEIAIRLRYIADELSKQELYQLPPDTQSLSFRALQDLVEICNVGHVFGRHDNKL